MLVVASAPLSARSVVLSASGSKLRVPLHPIAEDQELPSNAPLCAPPVFGVVPSPRLRHTLLAMGHLVEVGEEQSALKEREAH